MPVTLRFRPYLNIITRRRNSLVRVKIAWRCSVPTGRGDEPVTPLHERAARDRQEATTMTRDSVQQDMFTVLHGQPAPVVTRWGYSAHDPFAVSLAVRTKQDRWVEWLISRELVVDALAAPAGIGDVRMSPQVVQGYQIVQIEIRSHDGRAVMEVDRELLRQFVGATTELVALGDESRRMDMDGEIAKITQSCAE
jgi:Streptomyces sporulation and cell division protein, SsgA